MVKEAPASASESAVAPAPAPAKTPTSECSTIAPAPAPARSAPQRGRMDLRRQAMIARGGPIDHAGEVIIVAGKPVDLNLTIFRTLDSWMARKVSKERLEVSLYWNEDAAAQIHALYAAAVLPKSLDPNKGLVEFMTNECQFAMEHADGSFMDHLQFCYEYCHQHMPHKHSPRVLLTHSILGVATNIFPMKLEKLSRFRSFLSESEFQHIEAFPSILRLLYHNPLLAELEETSTRRLQEELQGIRFHRLIDNEERYMDVGAFWVQLNYQLIHLLDLLPTADWKANKYDGYMRVMYFLHRLLSRCDRLFVKVDLSLSRLVEAIAPFNGKSSSHSSSCFMWFFRNIPEFQKHKMSSQVARWSAEIGHDLKYELEWKDVKNAGEGVDNENSMMAQRHSYQEQIGA